MTWDYNRAQLQGLTTDARGKYCCLIALYMDRSYTPKQFISLFDACIQDQQVKRLFTTECHPTPGVNAAAAAYKKVCNLPFLIIPKLTRLMAGSS